MKLEIIDMDPNAARKAFLEYRAAVRERHTDEDAQIMRGYRELAKGGALISLTRTIERGGHMVVDRRPRPRADSNRHIVPRLAVIRASARWCWLSTTTNGIVIFHEDPFDEPHKRRRRMAFPAGTLPEQGIHGVSRGEFKALVPSIPPALRPKAKLENYHILWEAEWQAEPPADPALLRHIGGDLYAVLATWDLTELERAVLAQHFGR